MNQYVDQEKLKELERIFNTPIELISRRLQTQRENKRLWALWQAQVNRPRFDGVTKRQTKTISGKQGFHAELYISRRGFSKYGTPVIKDEPLA